MGGRGGKGGVKRGGRGYLHLPSHNALLLVRGEHGSAPPHRTGACGGSGVSRCFPRAVRAPRGVGGEEPPLCPAPAGPLQIQAWGRPPRHQVHMESNGRLWLELMRGGGRSSRPPTCLGGASGGPPQSGVTAAWSGARGGWSESPGTAAASWSWRGRPAAAALPAGKWERRRGGKGALAPAYPRGGGDQCGGKSHDRACLGSRWQRCEGLQSQGWWSSLDWRLLGSTLSSASVSLNSQHHCPCPPHGKVLLCAPPPARPPHLRYTHTPAPDALTCSSCDCRRLKASRGSSSSE